MNIHLNRLFPFEKVFMKFILEYGVFISRIVLYLFKRL